MLSPEQNRTYLVFWEGVSPEVTRVLLNRRLFGYRAGTKTCEGAVQRFGCERLGKGCISVPSQNLKQILEIFNSLNIQFKLREVVDFGEKSEKTLIEA